MNCKRWTSKVRGTGIWAKNSSIKYTVSRRRFRATTNQSKRKAACNCRVYRCKATTSKRGTCIESRNLKASMGRWTSIIRCSRASGRTSWNLSARNNRRGLTPACPTVKKTMIYTWLSSPSSRNKPDRKCNMNQTNTQTIFQSKINICGVNYKIQRISIIIQRESQLQDLITS